MSSLVRKHVSVTQLKAASNLRRYDQAISHKCRLRLRWREAFAAVQQIATDARRYRKTHWPMI